jgi:Calcineurin-like phosphoesterase
MGKNPGAANPSRRQRRVEPQLRYAHPFFTSTPPAARPPSPRAGGATRMSDWASNQVGPIPPPVRSTTFSLADIIGTAGSDEIARAGTIRLHAVGDTGRTKGGTEPQDIAADMALDYHPDAGGRSPAFFLHLGDVIYDQNKDNAYRDQFYRPYKNYPGKIVAIAGNHDGETFPSTDPVPLRAFLANFCAPSATVPPIAKSVGIFRETIVEPGVYWLLDAPFVQILALYSNIVDGPGYLFGSSSKGGQDNTQIDWLNETALAIAKSRRGSATRKALIVAVHHPPFSSGGHDGSPEVLAALDKAFMAADIQPDAVLSGHAHNYQRYTRQVISGGKPKDIPFLVAGCGGHNDLPVPAAEKQQIGDHVYEKSLRGYGYLTVSVSAQRLQIDMWQVPSASDNIPFDTVAVDLQTGRLV